MTSRSWILTSATSATKKSYRLRRETGAWVVSAVARRDARTLQFIGQRFSYTAGFQYYRAPLCARYFAPWSPDTAGQPWTSGLKRLTGQNEKTADVETPGQGVSKPAVFSKTRKAACQAAFFCALYFAQRARCAAAILRRAATESTLFGRDAPPLSFWPTTRRAVIAASTCFNLPWRLLCSATNAFTAFSKLAM
jgi:hypothetical protein